MKDIKILFALLTMATLWSCDPLEDDIDKFNEQYAYTQDVEFTLGDDEYDFLDEEFGVGGFGSFDNEDQAREYIPAVLSDIYPALGDGSSALVTYNLYRGSSEAVGPYTSAEAFAFDEDVYEKISPQAADAGFLNNENEDEVASVLSTEIQDPVEGELVAVTYNYADVAYEDIQSISIYSQTFDDASSFDNYDVASIVGAEEWAWSSYSGDGFAKMSGYNGGAMDNEDYLISPEIDLTSYAGAKLRISQAINFLEDEVLGTDIAVMISADYEGDISSATWESLDLDAWPVGDSYDFFDSEVDLSAYDGEKVNIAFYYTSTTSSAVTWEVSSVKVEVGEPISTITKNEIFEYSEDAWDKADGVYALNSSDYDAMGDPGQYDNFSSSLPAESYIPQFLASKYPYAQEEDEIVVVYKYYSSSAGETQTRGNLYTFMGGTWTGFASEIETTLQFGNEDGTWVPDNTIKYTFTTQDYTDAGKEENGLGNPAARDNLNSFGNFGTQWSDEELLGVIDFILKLRFPSSEVGQKYLVTFNTYPGGDVDTHVELMDSGNYEEID